MSLSFCVFMMKENDEDGLVRKYFSHEFYVFVIEVLAQS